MTIKKLATLLAEVKETFCVTHDDTIRGLEVMLEVAKSSNFERTSDKEVKRAMGSVLDDSIASNLDRAGQ